VWWAVFGRTLDAALGFIYHALAGVPVLSAIGAYGLAIIALTIVIKTLLSPLLQLQLLSSKRSQDQQRKLAPQMAEVRKKFKGDRMKQQQAILELQKEHGVNPLTPMLGCLPSLLQLPILSALYFVFYGNARSNTFADHFLFIPHLNLTPQQNPLLHGVPIPALAYLVIPLLAAATTFVQSRMMQQPVNPAASDQEKQQQQMARQMQVLMPLMIGYFAIVTPAGLGLYWTVSNLFSIGQQYLVNGWGGLLRRPAPAPSGTQLRRRSERSGSNGTAARLPAKTQPLKGGGAKPAASKANGAKAIAPKSTSARKPKT